MAPSGVLVGRGTVRTKRQKGLGDAQRRLAELGAVLRPLLLRARLAVVEWPSGGFGGSALTAALTAAAAGLAVGLARGLEVAVLTPSPVTWRHALGAERGKDAALHAALAERYRSDLLGLRRYELPHVLDAVGLALYAEQFWEQVRETKKWRTR